MPLVAWAALRLANTRESVYSVPNPDRAIGGIRFKLTRQWFRIDTIQHVASFYLKLLAALAGAGSLAVARRGSWGMDKATAGTAAVGARIAPEVRSHAEAWERGEAGEQSRRSKKPPSAGAPPASCFEPAPAARATPACCN